MRLINVNVVIRIIIFECGEYTIEFKLHVVM